jgi:hypothetical protein
VRLWTLHPRYLDARGLVALWREALLAQAVLAGKTRGYRHHPQLVRFQEARAPGDAIGAYLRAVHDEATRRGYRFDSARISSVAGHEAVPATDGQLAFEWRHLRAKLRVRDPDRLREIKGVKSPEPHPLFAVVAGIRAAWERSSPRKARG